MMPDMKPATKIPGDLSKFSAGKPFRKCAGCTRSLSPSASGSLCDECQRWKDTSAKEPKPNSFAPALEAPDAGGDC